MESSHPDGLYRRMLIRLLVVVAAVVLLLTVGRWVFGLLLPFLAAWLVAWAMNGVAARLRKRIHLPYRAATMLATALLFLLGAAFLGYLVWRVGSEAISLSQSWQSILDDVGAWFETVGSQMRRLSAEELALLEQLGDTLQSAVSSLVGSVGSALASWAGDQAKQLPSVLLGTVVFIFAAFLMVADYEDLYAKLNNMLSTDPDHPVHTVKHILRGTFGDYLGQLLLLSAAVMAVDLVGLLILDVQYAALLALLMGVLDFLPFVGSGTILIPWGVVCLFGGQPVRGAGLLVLYLIVRFVRSYFGRHFERKRAEFGAFGVLVCVFVGWKLWGVAGIILGPVLVMVAVNMYHNGFFDAALGDCKLAYHDLRRRMGLQDDTDDISEE